MAPDLPDDLWAGWMGLEGICGLGAPRGFDLDPQRKKWVLRCRLSADVLEEGPVPRSTDWYVLVDGDYPNGEIRFLPAKKGGLSQTFRHQRSNAESKDDPWRYGEICLDTTVRALGRHGGDPEPRAAHTRLQWRFRRALEWLVLASRDQLLGEGDPYELPDFAPSSELEVVAFCEDADSFTTWNRVSERSGLVEYCRFRASPNLDVITAFLASDKSVRLRLKWGREVTSIEQKRVGAWLYLDRPPVFPPYQVPAAWDELAAVCEMQGADLYGLLRPVVRFLRDGNNHPLLVGFPIPEKEGGPLVSMHWQAMALPVLSRGRRARSGFRNSEEGYWRQDRHSVLCGRNPIDWRRSENWASQQISARGRVSDALSLKRVLIIGVGAIGSVLAELLVRAGVRRLVLMDADALAAGNLARHTLTLDSMCRAKAAAVGARLNLASPHASVEAIGFSFPPVRRQDTATVQECDIVVDCTADDNVLSRLNAVTCSDVRHFLSVSTGFRAQRLFVFAAFGTEFPYEAFRDAILPWLTDEKEALEQADLPREGIGCWNPVLPARIDDVWALTSLVVRCIEEAVARPAETPRLDVFEQHYEDGRFMGIRRTAEPARRE